MNPILRPTLCVNLLCLMSHGMAQDEPRYLEQSGIPDANYYTIVAETDSILKALPPDTSTFEPRGQLFGRWKWFWESRMGAGSDRHETGKFSHYLGVLKSLVEDKACVDPTMYPAAWDLLGPVQLPRQEMGRIDAVARDPVDHSMVYAGATFGGLWRTNNVDAPDPIWVNLTDYADLPGMGIYDILIDPTDRDIIYIATGFGWGMGGVGVLKTTNGTSAMPDWQFTDLSYNPFLNETASVKKLAMSPIDPQTIYAFTNNEVFKTTDGGLNWPSLGISAAFPDLKEIIDPAVNS